MSHLPDYFQGPCWTFCKHDYCFTSFRHLGESGQPFHFSPVSLHLLDPENPDQHDPGETGGWDQSKDAYDEHVLLDAQILCQYDSGSSHSQGPPHILLMTCSASDMSRSRRDHQRTPKQSSLLLVSWGPPVHLWLPLLGGGSWRNIGTGCGCLQGICISQRTFLSIFRSGVLSCEPQGMTWSHCQHRNWDYPPHEPKLADRIFNAIDSFHLYTFTNISSSEPLCPLFCPGIPREGENVKPMEICAKEAIDVEFDHSPCKETCELWPKWRAYGVKLMDRILPDSIWHYQEFRWLRKPSSLFYWKGSLRIRIAKINH